MGMTEREQDVVLERGDGRNLPFERFPLALALGYRSNSLFDRVIHRLGESTCADHALREAVAARSGLSTPVVHSHTAPANRPATVAGG
jgi:hypothetical protein